MRANFINFIKNNLFLIIMLLIIFNNRANADFGRKTTFDNRQKCEQNKGVWREFGNGCVDECFAKFDEFGVCTYARTFGCDCGRGKCWSGNECMAVIEYKKVFDKMKIQEFEEISKLKLKRIVEAKKYQQDLIRRMIENRSSLTVNEFDEKDKIIEKNTNNFSNNNYSEIYKKKYPQIVKDNNNDPSQSQTNNQNNLKSIQHQPHEINNNQKNLNNNETRHDKNKQLVVPDPNYKQQSLTSDPNQNQQLIIQQPGIENQVINGTDLIQDPNSQNLNNNQSSLNKNLANGQKAVETFEIAPPGDFLKDSGGNKKSNELQLPVIEMPR